MFKNIIVLQLRQTIVKSLIPSSGFDCFSSSVGESGSMLTLLPYLSSVATLQSTKNGFYMLFLAQMLHIKFKQQRF